MAQHFFLDCMIETFIAKYFGGICLQSKETKPRIKLPPPPWLWTCSCPIILWYSLPFLKKGPGLAGESFCFDTQVNSKRKGTEKQLLPLWFQVKKISIQILNVPKLSLHENYPRPTEISRISGKVELPTSGNTHVDTVTVCLRTYRLLFVYILVWSDIREFTSVGNTSVRGTQAEAICFSKQNISKWVVVMD